MEAIILEWPLIPFVRFESRRNNHGACGMWIVLGNAARIILISLLNFFYQNPGKSFLIVNFLPALTALFVDLPACPIVVYV